MLLYSDFALYIMKQNWSKLLKRKKEENLIIVDGLNVLKHRKGIINLQNFEYIREWCRENGVSPLFILPRFRKFAKIYGGCSDVLLIDPRIYDDIAIIAYARELKAAILSNDKYREFRMIFRDFDFRRVFSYKITNGRIITNASDFFFFKDSTYFSKANVEVAIGGVK